MAVVHDDTSPDRIALCQESGRWIGKLICGDNGAVPLIAFASREDAEVWHNRDARAWLERRVRIERRQALG